MLFGLLKNFQIAFLNLNAKSSKFFISNVTSPKSHQIAKRRIRRNILKSVKIMAQTRWRQNSTPSKNTTPTLTTTK